MGLTTSIFSVVNGILLRSVPFPRPAQLVTLCEKYPGAPADWCSIAPPTVADIAEHSRTIASVGIARGWGYQLATERGPVGLNAGVASPEVFTALGVRPVLGRLIAPSDLLATGDEPRQSPVAVISHAMWQARFGGAAAVVGRAISLDDEAVTVVGVLPADFRLPEFEEAELWRPLHIAQRAEGHREWRGFVAYGRLRDGVTPAAARAELATITERLRERHFRDTPGWGVSLVRLEDLVVGGVRRTLLIFLGAVTLVLLVACANVANLLLARAAPRARELSLRTALGAGRGRLVRGLLVESLMLAGAGAALGLALAWGGVAGFRALAPAGIPRLEGVAIDGRVLGFAAALAVGTTLLFGLFPALRATHVSPAATLRAGGRGSTGGTGRVGAALVVAELGLAVVLLVGAGVLTRTFAATAGWKPGFEHGHVLAFQLFALPGTYRTPRDVGALWVRLADELRTVPGVVGVATASAGPVFGGMDGSDALPEGQPPTARTAIRWYDVSPSYFPTLGLPIVRGRNLGPTDVPGAPLAVVVNETFVRRYWPNDDPIGKRIEVGDDAPFTVVGVVRDVPPLRPGASVEPEMYWSNVQRPRWGTFVVVRTRDAPASVAGALRARIAAVDPALEPGAMLTLTERVGRQLVRPRFNMTLLGTFGVAALLLAAVGTYGLFAYLVSQRRREIGIRLALGADAGRVVAAIVRQGLALAGLGLVVGLLGALTFGRVLAHLVAGVSPRDPATLVVSCLVLAAVAGVACLLPARRASRVDPIDVLRAE
jgi:putative ABC transport system permease protein